MYSILRSIHSYWAFFVLIILVVAILNAFRGKSKGLEFSAKDLRLSLFGLIFSHIQLLIGLILSFVSPWFDQWSALDRRFGVRHVCPRIIPERRYKVLHRVRPEVRQFENPPLKICLIS